MSSIHQNSILQVPKRFHFLQKEKGVIKNGREKINAQRSIEKNMYVLQSKSIGKICEA
jgi:hypothetical protein